jgi:CRISPR-associated exonuclease Cas4
VYYAQSHQRQLVELSPELRAETIAAIAVVRELLRTGAMPTPVYTPRCQGCSLYDRCLPKARAQMSRYRELD